MKQTPTPELFHAIRDPITDGVGAPLPDCYTMPVLDLDRHVEGHHLFHVVIPDIDLALDVYWPGPAVAAYLLENKLPAEIQNFRLLCYEVLVYALHFLEEINPDARTKLERRYRGALPRARTKAETVWRKITIDAEKFLHWLSKGRPK